MVIGLIRYLTGSVPAEKLLAGQGNAVCLLLSTAFGIFVCSASEKMLNRQVTGKESVEMERAILAVNPFTLQATEST